MHDVINSAQQRYKENAKNMTETFSQWSLATSVYHKDRNHSAFSRLGYVRHIVVILPYIHCRIS